jgi:predicted CopG family antitoxin
MTESCTIRVHKKTKEELSKIGSFNDSYNTIIERLIQEHKKAGQAQ